MAQQRRYPFDRAETADMVQARRLTVHLIRHGETTWSREGRCQGVTDVPLTGKGYRQAQALAEVFREEALSLILSSPLARARETAELIARPHGLSVTLMDELQEWNQGDTKGLTGLQLLRQHRLFFERWLQDPAGTAPPGGEPYRRCRIGHGR